MSGLLKRLLGGASSESRNGPGGELVEIELGWFLNSLTGRRAPRVLDLGMGKQRRVISLLEQGFRVTADDSSVAALGEVRIQSEEVLDQAIQNPRKFFALDLETASFDGALVWSSFDFLSYLGAYLLASELCRVLKEEGVIAGQFAAPLTRRELEALDAAGRAIIRGIGVHPAKLTNPEPGRYEVREILKLFPTFDLVHSMVNADGTRRLLIRKTASNPTLPFDEPLA